MDIPLTLTIGAVFLGLAIFSGWRGARPPDPRRGPRMMPWRVIMVTAAAGLLPILVHLLNLVGVTTGR
ncbi:hypothetical protein [Phenylobacterium sp.]|jgi:hypothetical protein|uniref:hypothetical protein n=1 Tax=Phenylobacterium sp. TaxID=1871053 RepID=UPI002F41D011